MAQIEKMPDINVNNINRFLFLKLPSAYLSGIRVHRISETEVEATVTHKWINQNPFKSLYWATQAMAAELVTGVLMMQKIKASGQRISMLVVKQNGEFFKKATGKIRFICIQGSEIESIIAEEINEGNGSRITLKAEGFDQADEMVSAFEFTWSIKLKKE